MQVRILSAFLGRDKGQVPGIIKLAREERVGIVCLQEVMDHEVPLLEQEYSFVRYIPMTEFANGMTMGLVTCTYFPVIGVSERYFMGSASHLDIFDESSAEKVNATKRRPFLTCSIDIDRESPFLNVANFHYPYSSDGNPNRDQDIVTEELVYSDIAELSFVDVACIALVSPRGWQIYEKLTKKGILRIGFDDCVPVEIDCTIDLDLHKIGDKIREGRIPRIVTDFIFNHGHRFTVSSVEQFHGVADHTPLVADIVRK